MFTFQTDNSPGYTRGCSGDRFRYRDPEGKLVHSKQLIERYSKRGIPPAYEKVWISPMEDDLLLFNGVDAAGRKQYRYHSAWNQLRNHPNITGCYRLSLACLLYA